MTRLAKLSVAILVLAAASVLAVPQVASAARNARGLSDADVERLERACEFAGGTVERDFFDNGFERMICKLPGGDWIVCGKRGATWTCGFAAPAPDDLDTSTPTTGTLSDPPSPSPSPTTSSVATSQSTSSSTPRPGPASRALTSPTATLR